MSSINISLKIKAQSKFAVLTVSEKYRRPMPTGMKAIPITKKVGSTVPAVRIGCHAGSLCCLNALSARQRSNLI